VLKNIDVEGFPALIETSQLMVGHKADFVFVAVLLEVGGGMVLVVTFFSLGSQIVAVRMFFNQTAFITEYLMPERKWSDATLDHFLSFWRDKPPAVCDSQRTAECVRKFFGADGESEPLELMRDFQRGIRKEQLAVRHRREMAKIDERMKEVGQLPQDFEWWVNETALDFSRYIYYKRATKRLIKGFCTSCQGEIEFVITRQTLHENVRHNEQGKCPVCRKTVTFKAVGRSTKVVDFVAVALMQKTCDGFMIRSFSVRKAYFDHYQAPELTISELVRDFVVGRNVASYEYANFKQTNQVRWRHSIGFFNLSNCCLYTRNIRLVLSGSEWQYSCLYELAKKIKRFNVFVYLGEYLNHPVYEYLIKLRLFRLVIENAMGWGTNKLNLEGRNFREVLGIEVAGLRQMQRLNGGIDHYKLIKKAGALGVRLTDGELEWFLRMGIMDYVLEEILPFVTPHKVIKYIGYCLENGQDRGHTYRSPAAEIATLWRDYLTNCALLGYDMKNSFVLFPKHLKTRHDEVMKLVDGQKGELVNKAVSALCSELQIRYGFMGKEMLVKAPVSADEIITDGHALHHCVGSGSYIENMAKGKSIILLVRLSNQPETPFFTMELRDGMVIQCRGMNNQSMTDEVKKFVEVWKKKIKLKN
jgi:hypothetical protein